MKDQIISLKTAKLLKEAGFKEPVRFYYGAPSEYVKKIKQPDDLIMDLEEGMDYKDVDMNSADDFP